MPEIGYFSLGVPACHGDAFSPSVSMVRAGEIVFHRILRLWFGRDGSVYLTLIRSDSGHWQVGKAPTGSALLSREVDTSACAPLGATDATKISFHASGAVNLGQFRGYRPPLRTLSQMEQLCLIHYGDPSALPAMGVSEFNAWAAKKGHPLVPIGMPFPGNVIATRVFVAPPLGFDAHSEFICPDFELMQSNLIVQFRGAPEEFPQDPDGAHGFDLVLSTGQWCGENWRGPLVVIPATGELPDSEAGRRGSS